MTDLSTLDSGIDWDAVRAANRKKADSAKNRDAVTSSADLSSLEGDKFVGKGVSSTVAGKVADTGSNFLNDILREVATSKMAFDSGVADEMLKTVAGPVQFGLERVAPETAQKFTDWVNKVTSPSEAQQEHPSISSAGGIVGGVGTLAAGGEALAPFKAGRALAAASKAAPIPTASGLGAALGLTSYQDEPQDLEGRAIDTAVGAAAGAAPGVVGRALKKGAEKASTSGAIKDFIEKTKNQVKDLAPHLSPLKDKIDAQFGRLKKQVDDAYTSRDVHGSSTVPHQDVVSGYDSLSKKLDTSTVNDVTGRVLPEVSEKLGIPDIRATVARNDAAVAEHQRALGDYQKDISEKYDSYLEEMQKQRVVPIDLQEFINAAQSPGINLPKMPGAPRLETVPKPQLSDVFNALTRVNADIKRTGNPAKSNQLNKVKDYLNGLVDASDHPDPAKAKTLMQGASDEYVKKIVPYRDQFGFKGFQKGATGKLTNADVYEQAVKLIEGTSGIHDVQALNSFKKLIGPGGARDMQNVALYRGLDKALENAGTAQERINPEKLSDYLQKNRRSLKLLVDPRQLNEMDGFAKLVAASKTQQGKGTHIVTPSILYALAGEEAIRGQIAHGAGLAASGITVHFGSRIFNKLTNNNVTSRIMQRAARYKPGSKELDGLLKQLGRATDVAGASAGLGAAEISQDVLGN